MRKSGKSFKETVNETLRLGLLSRQSARGVKPYKVRAKNLGDWKSTTSELQSPCNLVCRLLLEKKETPRSAAAWPVRPTSRCTAPGACPRARMPRFFFNDTATTEIYPLSLHDALPI